MTGLAIGHLVAGGALAGLALHALLNHVTVPKLGDMRAVSRLPRMSVLIPARNEAERIGATVTGWTRQDYPSFEVLVYDDDSEDDTAIRARAASGDSGRAQVVRGGPLPTGWRGKPWACQRLRTLASGDILVFADADIAPRADALARVAAALDVLEVDALSALPTHTGAGFAVRVLVGLQNWGALTFVPLWMAAARRRHHLAAMNGQFMAMRADVYDAVGGFAAVRDSLAEDTALGRRLVAGGHRVRLIDGARVVTCRAYESLRAVWTSNVRNLVPAFLGSGTLLLLALCTLLVLHAWPFAVLATAALTGRPPSWAWTGLPLAEILLGLASRWMADLRAGHGPWLALAHPLAVGALAAMGVGSAILYWSRGTVAWRGRRYRLAE